MRKTLSFFIINILFLCSTFSQTADTKLITSNAENWRADLKFLAEQMPLVHKNPYHTTSKEDMDKYIAEFNRNISSMTDNQILTGFAKLIAMIGDGHTRLNPREFHVYPVQTYIFKDGQYATDAFDEYKDAIGKKLVLIDNKPVDEVYNAVKTIVHRDNEMQLKSQMPLYMIISEVLDGLGLIKDINNVKFTFEDKDGKRTELNIKPVNGNEYFQKIHSRPLKDNLPLYRQNADKNYWFTYLEEPKVLYFQYNVVREDTKDSIKYFLKRLDEFVNSHEINKFIIDIRNNGGGNLFTSIPISNYIKQNPKINQRGKLFAILGRRTFSAASYFTTSLEYNTKVIFFGEPTGASPNHYGDHASVVLPNSKLDARLSTLYWENSFPFDKREWTAPHVTVEMNYDDFANAKDPVLDAILNYKTGQINSSAVSEDEIESISGRYVYSPDQVLEIKKVKDELKMEITDFFTTTLYPQSGGKYLTDITGVELYAKSKNEIVLNARGTELTLNRNDNKTLLPRELLNDGKVKEAIALLREVKKSAPNRSSISEGRLNNLGYDFLNKKDYDAAISIFKLNVEFYPNAFNTYDSLGEAYMMAGDKEKAIENYKKSIELNPNNEGGKKMLEKLQGK